MHSKFNNPVDWSKSGIPDSPRKVHVLLFGVFLLSPKVILVPIQSLIKSFEGYSNLLQTIKKCVQAGDATANTKLQKRKQAVEMTR